MQEFKAAATNLPWPCNYMTLQFPDVWTANISGHSGTGEDGIGQDTAQGKKLIPAATDGPRMIAPIITSTRPKLDLVLSLLPNQNNS